MITPQSQRNDHKPIAQIVTSRHLQKSSISPFKAYFNIQPSLSLRLNPNNTSKAKNKEAYHSIIYELGFYLTMKFSLPLPPFRKPTISIDGLIILHDPPFERGRDEFVF
jgi:hypothetical protein